MAKELTCEILKEYGNIDIDDKYSIKIVEVKWGGRQPKGYDIRKYSKEDGRLGKGINIPYDKIEELLEIIISNNLCNIKKIKEFIEKREKSYFTENDFMNMFSYMNNEMEKYTRDKHGLLRDENNRIVITSRRKKR